MNRLKKGFDGCQTRTQHFHCTEVCMAEGGKVERLHGLILRLAASKKLLSSETVSGMGPDDVLEET